MATKYLSRVLRGIDDVFNFRSSQKGAPSDVELDLPVQTVLDVGRYADYGAGRFGENFGWWIMGTSNIHTIVGKLIQTLSLQNAFANLNGYESGWDEDDFMAWVFRAWCTNTDQNDFADCQTMIQNSATSVGPGGASGQAAVRHMIFRGEASIGVASGDRPIFSLNEPSESLLPMPILARNDIAGANIVMNSNADNAGTVEVDFNLLFWLGPKGVLPPRI